MSRFLVSSLFCFAITGCRITDGYSLNDQLNTTFVFDNGQPAEFVVGQPDFLTTSSGLSSNRLGQPQGLSLGASGTLWCADPLNNRIMGFVEKSLTMNGTADYVLGQGGFASNASTALATGLNTPSSVAEGPAQLYVTDRNNERVLVYDAVPHSSFPAAAYAIYAANPDVAGASGCTATTSTQPMNVAAGGNILAVSDQCNRVMIFRTPITQNAPTPLVVIGQPNATSNGTATTQTGLNVPDGVWTDGTKLLIYDTGNCRVIGYNSIPTTDGAPADFVIGQTDFTTSACVTSRSGMGGATNIIGSLTSNGRQIFVADIDNSRVLLYNNWPESNGVSADSVLGQVNFTTKTFAASQILMQGPFSVQMSYPYLYVTDAFSNRIMVWKSK